MPTHLSKRTTSGPKLPTLLSPLAPSVITPVSQAAGQSSAIALVCLLWHGMDSWILRCVTYYHTYYTYHTYYQALYANSHPTPSNQETDNLISEIESHTCRALRETSVWNLRVNRMDQSETEALMCDRKAVSSETSIETATSMDLSTESWD